MKYLLLIFGLLQTLTAQEQVLPKLQANYQGCMILCRQKLAANPKDTNGLILLSALYQIDPEHKEFQKIRQELKINNTVAQYVRLIDDGKQLSKYSAKIAPEIKAPELRKACLIIARYADPKNKDVQARYQKYISSEFLHDFLQPVKDLCDIDSLTASHEELALKALASIEVRTLSFGTDDLMRLINYMIPRAESVNYTISVKSLPNTTNIKATKTSSGHTLYNALRIPILNNNSHKFTNTNLADLLTFIDLTYRIQLEYKKDEIIISTPDSDHWKSKPTNFRRASSLHLLNDYDVGEEALKSLYKNERYIQFKGTLKEIIQDGDKYLIKLSEGGSFSFPANKVNLENITEAQALIAKHYDRSSSTSLKYLNVVIRADVSSGVDLMKAQHIFLPYSSKFLTQ